MSWSAAAAWSCWGALVLIVAVIAGCGVLHEESRHRRAIKRWRRQRRRAWETLRSTAPRDVYREFTRGGKP